jgi:hypothetical protein
MEYMMPCTLVYRYKGVRRAYSLLLLLEYPQDFKLEAVCSAKSMMHIHQTTCFTYFLNYPEDGSNMLLQNFTTYYHCAMVTHPR